MVEGWNIGFKEDDIDSIALCHFFFTHFSSIPVFQHSDSEQSETVFITTKTRNVKSTKLKIFFVFVFSLFRAFVVNKSL
jgi:hypothetical protein